MALFDEIARVYEDELRVPRNNVCLLRCDARYKQPLLPWHLGDRFEEDALRLVIVARPHRQDQPMGDRPSGVQDGRAAADRMFRTKTWALWRTTRALLARLFGSAEEGWRRVALTTVVKCANSSGGTEGNDRTTRNMKVCCLQEVGVLRGEMGALRPRTLLLLTGREYDDWLDRLLWDRRQRWRDLTPRPHVRTCGDAPLPWWEREIAGLPPVVRVLRLGVPQGKPLRRYVDLAAAWAERVDRPGAARGQGR